MTILRNGSIIKLSKKNERGDEMKDNLITLKEYAKMHKRNPGTVRQKALRGNFKTAVKVGRDWLIDKNEPYTDQRKKL